MTASSVFTAPGRSSVDRGLIARTAARTAPRGPGLAPVVALPTPATTGTGNAPSMPERRSAPVEDVRPRLRLVEGRRSGSRASSLRSLRGPARIVLVLASLLLVGSVLAGSVRTVLSDPIAPEAAGHVVLEPGETLWDIAVRSAPAGVDPREQLDALRRLNGFASATLDAWTVVLLPAR